MLGQQQPLDCTNLEKLVEARSRYLGVNSAAPMPVFSENAEVSSMHMQTSTRNKPQRSNLRPRETASLLGN
jgi:hypothetical protein